jgi:glutathione peroxidase
MKKIVLLSLLVAPLLLNGQNHKTLHSYAAKTIVGDTFPMSQLAGKKVLIVNTASKCGLTPQYKDLEALYQKYKGTGFTIVGFPANNFMNQEPGTNQEIKEFCEVNYGVSFPMMAKISVKGDDIHPIYQWLTEKEKNGKMDSKIKWNFQKYLVDEQGKLIATYPPKTNPMDEEITAWIEGK